MKRHESSAPQEAAITEALAQLKAEPERAVQALSALCAAAKSRADRIREELQEHDALYAALRSQEPKARKNAARLMGALGDARDVPALITALEAEDTRFVRPSMILALGALGGDAAYAALSALPIPQEDTDKHAREEAEAIRTACARLAPPLKHTFTGLPKPMDVLLRVPESMGELLREELAALDIPVRRVLRDGVWAQVSDLRRLYRARCFDAALFPLAQNVALPQGAFVPAAAAKLLAAAARVPLNLLLTGCHDGEPPYSYRIECPGKLDRGAFTRALAAQLDPTATLLRNAPSQYECEVFVRLQEAAGKFDLPQYSSADVFCRLLTYPDQRFAYRKHAISASIQPAMAAALARYAMQYAPKRPLRVLDPCCGSGTLLIELEKRLAHEDAMACESLLGLDIVGATAEKARENCAAAHSHARILHKDCRAFTPNEPVDLLLCNLPFGLRVGTHESNEALYAALVHQLTRWLAPDGAALLYTMEYKLLNRCIRAQAGLRVLGEARTAAGGLAPWVIVCGRR